VLHQRWQGLVFLHWAFDPAELGSALPAGLHLDTFKGRAWVGLTPFHVSRMRPTLLPALPWLSEANEINLRVYVHREGIPGIWFPSLEITNRLAMWGARIAYRLPYFHARMRVERDGDVVAFTSRRSGDARAWLDACWRVGAPLPAAEPGSLEHFLTERYVLYSGDSERMLRARIHHRPWPLRAATLLTLRSTLLEADGIATPTAPAHVLAQDEPFDVEIWPPTSA